MEGEIFDTSPIIDKESNYDGNLSKKIDPYINFETTQNEFNQISNFINSINNELVVNKIGLTKNETFTILEEDPSISENKPYQDLENLLVTIKSKLNLNSLNADEPDDKDNNFNYLYNAYYDTYEPTKFDKDIVNINKIKNDEIYRIITKIKVENEKKKKKAIENNTKFFKATVYPFIYVVSIYLVCPVVINIGFPLLIKLLLKSGIIVKNIRYTKQILITLENIGIIDKKLNFFLLGESFKDKGLLYKVSDDYQKFIQDYPKKGWIDFTDELFENDNESIDKIDLQKFTNVNLKKLMGNLIEIFNKDDILNNPQYLLGMAVEGTIIFQNGRSGFLKDNFLGMTKKLINRPIHNFIYSESINNLIDPINIFASVGISPLDKLIGLEIKDSNFKKYFGNWLNSISKEYLRSKIIYFKESLFSLNDNHNEDELNTNNNKLDKEKESELILRKKKEKLFREGYSYQEVDIKMREDIIYQELKERKSKPSKLLSEQLEKIMIIMKRDTKNGLEKLLQNIFMPISATYIAANIPEVINSLKTSERINDILGDFEGSPTSLVENIHSIGKSFNDSFLKASIEKKGSLYFTYYLTLISSIGGLDFLKKILDRLQRKFPIKFNPLGLILFIPLKIITIFQYFTSGLYNRTIPSFSMQEIVKNPTGFTIKMYNIINSLLDPKQIDIGLQNIIIDNYIKPLTNSIYLLIPEIIKIIPIIKSKVKEYIKDKTPKAVNQVTNSIYKKLLKNLIFKTIYIYTNKIYKILSGELLIFLENSWYDYLYDDTNINDVNAVKNDISYQYDITFMGEKHKDPVQLVTYPLRYIGKKFFSLEDEYDRPDKPDKIKTQNINSVYYYKIRQLIPWVNKISLKYIFEDLSKLDINIVMISILNFFNKLVENIGALNLIPYFFGKTITPSNHYNIIDSILEIFFNVKSRIQLNKNNNLEGKTIIEKTKLTPDLIKNKLEKELNSDNISFTSLLCTDKGNDLYLEKSKGVTFWATWLLNKDIFFIREVKKFICDFLLNDDYQFIKKTKGVILSSDGNYVYLSKNNQKDESAEYYIAKYFLSYKDYPDKYGSDIVSPEKWNIWFESKLNILLDDNDETEEKTEKQQLLKEIGEYWGQSTNTDLRKEEEEIKKKYTDFLTLLNNIDKYKDNPREKTNLEAVLQNIESEKIKEKIFNTLTSHEFNLEDNYEDNIKNLIKISKLNKDETEELKKNILFDIIEKNIYDNILIKEILNSNGFKNIEQINNFYTEKKNINKNLKLFDEIISNEYKLPKSIGFEKINCEYPKNWLDIPDLLNHCKNYQDAIIQLLVNILNDPLYRSKNGYITPNEYEKIKEFITIQNNEFIPQFKDKYEDNKFEEIYNYFNNLKKNHQKNEIMILSELIYSFKKNSKKAINMDLKEKTSKTKELTEYLSKENKEKVFSERGEEIIKIANLHTKYTYTIYEQELFGSNNYLTSLLDSSQYKDNTNLTEKERIFLSDNLRELSDNLSELSDNLTNIIKRVLSYGKNIKDYNKNPDILKIDILEDYKNFFNDNGEICNLNKYNLKYKNHIYDGTDLTFTETYQDLIDYDLRNKNFINYSIEIINTIEKCNIDIHKKKNLKNKINEISNKNLDLIYISHQLHPYHIQKILLDNVHNNRLFNNVINDLIKSLKSNDADESKIKMLEILKEDKKTSVIEKKNKINLLEFIYQNMVKNTFDQIDKKTSLENKYVMLKESDYLVINGDEIKELYNNTKKKLTNPLESCIKNINESSYVNKDYTITDPIMNVNQLQTFIDSYSEFKYDEEKKIFINKLLHQLLLLDGSTDYDIEKYKLITNTIKNIENNPLEKEIFDKINENDLIISKYIEDKGKLQLNKYRFINLLSNLKSINQELVQLDKSVLILTDNEDEIKDIFKSGFNNLNNEYQFINSLDDINYWKPKIEKDKENKLTKTFFESKNDIINYLFTSSGLTEPEKIDLYELNKDDNVEYEFSVYKKYQGRPWGNYSNIYNYNVNLKELDIFKKGFILEYGEMLGDLVGLRGFEINNLITNLLKTNEGREYINKFLDSMTFIENKKNYISNLRKDSYQDFFISDLVKKKSIHRLENTEYNLLEDILKTEPNKDIIKFLIPEQGEQLYKLYQNFKDINKKFPCNPNNIDGIPVYRQRMCINKFNILKEEDNLLNYRLQLIELQKKIDEYENSPNSIYKFVKNIHQNLSSKKEDLKKKIKETENNIQLLKEKNIPYTFENFIADILETNDNSSLTTVLNCSSIDILHKDDKKFDENNQECNIKFKRDKLNSLMNLNLEQNLINIYFNCLNYNTKYNEIMKSKQKKNDNIEYDTNKVFEKRLEILRKFKKNELPYKNIIDIFINTPDNVILSFLDDSEKKEFNDILKEETNLIKNIQNKENTLDILLYIYNRKSQDIKDILIEKKYFENMNENLEFFMDKEKESTLKNIKKSPLEDIYNQGRKFGATGNNIDLISILYFGKKPTDDNQILLNQRENNMFLSNYLHRGKLNNLGPSGMIRPDTSEYNEFSRNSSSMNFLEYLSEGQEWLGKFLIERMSKIVNEDKIVKCLNKNNINELTIDDIICITEACYEENKRKDNKKENCIELLNTGNNNNLYINGYFNYNDNEEILIQNQDKIYDLYGNYRIDKYSPNNNKIGIIEWLPNYIYFLENFKKNKDSMTETAVKLYNGKQTKINEWYEKIENINKNIEEVKKLEIEFNTQMDEYLGKKEERKKENLKQKMTTLYNKKTETIKLIYDLNIFLDKEVLDKQINDLSIKNKKVEVEIERLEILKLKQLSNFNEIFEFVSENKNTVENTDYNKIPELSSLYKKGLIQVQETQGNIVESHIHKHHQHMYPGEGIGEFDKTLLKTQQDKDIKDEIEVQTQIEDKAVEEYETQTLDLDLDLELDLELEEKTKNTEENKIKEQLGGNSGNNKALGKGINLSNDKFPVFEDKSYLEEANNKDLEDLLKENFKEKNKQSQLEKCMKIISCWYYDTKTNKAEFIPLTRKSRVCKYLKIEDIQKCVKRGMLSKPTKSLFEGLRILFQMGINYIRLYFGKMGTEIFDDKSNWKYRLRTFFGINLWESKEEEEIRLLEKKKLIYIKIKYLEQKIDNFQLEEDEKNKLKKLIKEEKKKLLEYKDETSSLEEVVNKINQKYSYNFLKEEYKKIQYNLDAIDDLLPDNLLLVLPNLLDKMVYDKIKDDEDLKQQYESENTTLYQFLERNMNNEVIDNQIGYLYSILTIGMTDQIQDDLDQSLGINMADNVVNMGMGAGVGAIGIAAVVNWWNPVGWVAFAAGSTLGVGAIAVKEYYKWNQKNYYDKKNKIKQQLQSQTKKLLYPNPNHNYNLGYNKGDLIRNIYKKHPINLRNKEILELIKKFKNGKLEEKIDTVGDLNSDYLQIILNISEKINENCKKDEDIKITSKDAFCLINEDIEVFKKKNLRNNFIRPFKNPYIENINTFNEEINLIFNKIEKQINISNSDQEAESWYNNFFNSNLQSILNTLSILKDPLKINNPSIIIDSLTDIIYNLIPLSESKKFITDTILDFLLAPKYVGLSNEQSNNNPVRTIIEKILENYSELIKKYNTFSIKYKKKGNEECYTKNDNEGKQLFFIINEISQSKTKQFKLCENPINYYQEYFKEYESIKNDINKEITDFNSQDIVKKKIRTDLESIGTNLKKYFEKFTNDLRFRQESFINIVNNQLNPNIKNFSKNYLKIDDNFFLNFGEKNLELIIREITRKEEYLNSNVIPAKWIINCFNSEDVSLNKDWERFSLMSLYQLNEEDFKKKVNKCKYNDIYNKTKESLVSSRTKDEFLLEILENIKLEDYSSLEIYIEKSKQFLNRKIELNNLLKTILLSDKIPYSLILFFKIGDQNCLEDDDLCKELKEKYKDINLNDYPYLREYLLKSITKDADEWNLFEKKYRLNLDYLKETEVSYNKVLNWENIQNNKLMVKNLPVTSFSDLKVMVPIKKDEHYGYYYDNIVGNEIIFNDNLDFELIPTYKNVEMLEKLKETKDYDLYSFLLYNIIQGNGIDKTIDLSDIVQYIPPRYNKILSKDNNIYNLEELENNILYIIDAEITRLFKNEPLLKKEDFIKKILGDKVNPNDQKTYWIYMILNKIINKYDTNDLKNDEKIKNFLINRYINFLQIEPSSTFLEFKNTKPSFENKEEYIDSILNQYKLVQENKFKDIKDHRDKIIDDENSILEELINNIPLEKLKILEELKKDNIIYPDYNENFPLEGKFILQNKIIKRENEEMKYNDENEIDNMYNKFIKFEKIENEFLLDHKCFEEQPNNKFKLKLNESEYNCLIKNEKNKNYIIENYIVDGEKNYIYKKYLDLRLNLDIQDYIDKKLLKNIRGNNYNNIKESEINNILIMNKIFEDHEIDELNLIDLSFEEIVNLPQFLKSLTEELDYFTKDLEFWDDFNNGIGRPISKLCKDDQLKKYNKIVNLLYNDGNEDNNLSDALCYQKNNDWFGFFFKDKSDDYIVYLENIKRKMELKKITKDRNTNNNIIINKYLENLKSLYLKRVKFDDNLNSTENVMINFGVFNGLVI